MAQKSWQVTITTAGTAVIGPTTGPGDFLVKPAPGNTGASIYIGNDGSNDVSSTTGYAISSGNQIIVRTKNMNNFYFDALSDGDKVHILLNEDLPSGGAPPVRG